MNIMLLKDNEGSFLLINDLSELVMNDANGKKMVIEKNIYDDFDAIITESDTVYILAVTVHGSLVLFKVINDGKIQKRIILDTKNNQKKICSVKLMNIEGYFHAFYCIYHNSKMMMVHHIINVGSFTVEPRVIDYIYPKCIYDVCVDNDNNINLIYVDEEGQIKHTRYKYSQKSYEQININYSSDVKAISCICTADSTFAAFLTKSNDYNVIECLDTISGKTAMVGFGVDKISKPCLITDGKDLCVQWCEKDYGFESIADDKFIFSKPQMIASECKEIFVRIAGNDKHMFVNSCLSGLRKGLLGIAKKISLDFDSLSLDKLQDNVEEVFAKDDWQYQINLLEQKVLDLESKLDALAKQLIEMMNGLDNTKPELADVGEIDEENLKKFNDFNFEDENNNLEVDADEQ